MSLISYVNYLNQNLGIGEFVLPKVLEFEINKGESLLPTLLWEDQEVLKPQLINSIEILFVRLMRASQIPLREDKPSFILFENLRKAMGYNAERSPYVEIMTEENFILDDNFVRTLNEVFELLKVNHKNGKPKIIFLNQDDFVSTDSSRCDWIIPDPSILVKKPELKRPTWDLLKTRACTVKDPIKTQQ